MDRIINVTNLVGTTIKTSSIKRPAGGKEWLWESWLGAMLGTRVLTRIRIMSMKYDGSKRGYKVRVRSMSFFDGTTKSKKYEVSKIVILSTNKRKSNFPSTGRETGTFRWIDLNERSCRQSREWVTQKSVPKWDLSSSSLGLYITKPMIVANTATSLHATAFDQWDGSALSFRFVNFHSYQASWLSRRVGPCRRPNRIDCCRTRKCATSDKLCRSGSRRSRPREWNLCKCHSWSRWINWEQNYREVSKRSSWWRCRVSFAGREWPGAWSGGEGNDWIVPFQTKEKEELVGWECRRQSWRPRRERAGTGTATGASHTPWSRSHWSAGESHWSGARGVDQCRRRQGRRRRNWRAHSDNHSKRCPEMEWSVEENTHKNSIKMISVEPKTFF